MTSNKHFQIYSSYDGWEIQMLEDGEVRGYWCWDHEEFDFGVGGEKMFAQVLHALGHSTYGEEVC